MKITNYTLEEFSKQSPELISEYITALNYLPAKQTRRKIFHMKLKHVEFIKTNLGSGIDDDLISIFAKVQKIKKNEVYKVEIIEFFGILNSIKEQIKEISTAEETSLMPTYPDLKWEMVQGSKKMAKFGIVNTLDMLSGNDATKHEYYRNMKYSYIFLLLLKRKTESDLQHEMSLIKTK
jgi:hypothetical protein